MTESTIESASRPVISRFEVSRARGAASIHLRRSRTLKVYSKIRRSGRVVYPRSRHISILTCNFRWPSRSFDFAVVMVSTQQRLDFLSV